MIVIVIVILIFTFCLGVLMLVRNEWVYRVRKIMSHENPELYDKLPSYDNMMIHFWVWNINKFITN